MATIVAAQILPKIGKIAEDLNTERNAKIYALINPLNPLDFINWAIFFFVLVIVTILLLVFKPFFILIDEQIIINNKLIKRKKNEVDRNKLILYAFLITIIPYYIISLIYSYYSFKIKLGTLSLLKKLE